MPGPGVDFLPIPQHHALRGVERHEIADRFFFRLAQQFRHLSVMHRRRVAFGLGGVIPGQILLRLRPVPCHYADSFAPVGPSACPWRRAASSVRINPTPWWM